MSTVKRVILSVLVIGLALTGVAMTETPTQYVDVQGIGAIMSGDVGGGKDRAIQDALRKAVEQVVGTMVDSETLIENFQTVNDRIYTQSSGFICKYDVTAERQDNLNYYVTVHACVQVGKLEDNLLAVRICLRRIDNPRTMLMIAEQNVGEDLHGWWYNRDSDLSIVETKIMEDFNEKDFALIDPKIASGNFNTQKAIRGEPEPRDAILIGKAFSAEYVIIGKAVAKCNGKDQYQFYNCYANITARIVKVDTGKIFGTATASGKMAHIEEHESGVIALQKAANLVAPKLIKAVTTRCTKETSGGGNEYTIKLTGVSSMSKLTAFMQACEEIRGVSQVIQRAYSNGQAEVEIMYKGRVNDLAKDIEAKTGANVTGASANTIKVRLK